MLGNGVVINLPQFFEEIKKNEEKGLACCKGRVFISNRAHIGIKCYNLLCFYLDINFFKCVEISKDL